MIVSVPSVSVVAPPRPPIAVAPPLALSYSTVSPFCRPWLTTVTVSSPALTPVMW